MISTRQSGSLILSYPLRHRYGLKRVDVPLVFLPILQKVYTWLKDRFQKTVQPESPILITPALGDLDKLLMEWKPKDFKQENAKEIDPVTVRLLSCL